MNYATIEGFEKMSAQELFDMSAAHLLKQGCKSVSENGQCLYNGPNNTTCAAGIFLRPERRDDCDYAMGRGSKPGASWWATLQRKKLVPFSVNDQLIKDLQKAHDDSSRANDSFMPEVVERLRDVAKFHVLSTAVLEKAP